MLGAGACSDTTATTDSTDTTATTDAPESRSPIGAERVFHGGGPPAPRGLDPVGSG